MPQLTEPVASNIKAVLGPTNTGKTHRCIERMLEFETGMIGLPLRLLAREVYDRITVRVGEQRVALVTGEEKRIPKHPDYWICTVEAMPTTLEVDFVAVDEIQLVAHATRGHVFTQRLLQARGRHETWFLGSDTVTRLIEQLAPAAKLEAFPRLSKLTFSGAHTLGRLPPRSAVIAFSLPEVYALAERIRARKGGAAVVLGALSPRTRNAQVAMYQAGEVDHLVATDAIGMGLNLSLEHVAFASLKKFDGYRNRELHARELSQIAGRAGRYLTDGTFSVLSPEESPEPDVLHSIERHRFEPHRFAYWRNFELDFSSLDALLATLDQPSKRGTLKRLLRADDSDALRHLALRPRIRERCRGTLDVELLWEVCQIPDYRKLLPELHAALVLEIFEELTRHGTLSDTWLEERVAPLDDSEGDIDALMGRIAFIRTWTYVAERSEWLDSPRAWREKTRSIEDRLSDALHDRLVRRFVERTRKRLVPTRSSVREPAFERLLALKLALEGPPEAPSDDWLAEAIEAQHGELFLSPDAKILYRGHELGCLVAGKSLLHPEVSLSRLNAGTGEHARLRRRLVAFARDVVVSLLRDWHDGEPKAGAVRGLLYQLAQNLGSVPRKDIESQLATMSEADRDAILQRGVRIGQLLVWVPKLLLSEPLRTRRALVRAFRGREGMPEADLGGVSLPRAGGAGTGRHFAHPLQLGYVALGPRYVRCDIAERALEQLLHSEVDHGKLCALLGCRKRELARVLSALSDSVTIKTRYQQPNSRNKPRKRRRPQTPAFYTTRDSSPRLPPRS